MPANFKTYEAQSRLIASIIAAHPELKLNYKEIARYFGESTPDGIGWQFRSIKADADKLKKAVDAGQSPASALGRSLSGATPAATPKSARKRMATATPRTASSKKAKKPTPRKDSDSDGDGEVDYETLDSTPSKEPKRRTYIDYDVLERVTGHPQQPIMSGALPGLDTAHEPTPSEDEFIPTPTQTYAPVQSFNSTQPSQNPYSSFDMANGMSDTRWNTMADNHKNFIDPPYLIDSDEGEI